MAASVMGSVDQDQRDDSDHKDEDDRRVEHREVAQERGVRKTVNAL